MWKGHVSWYIIGEELGINQGKLDKIKKEEKSSEDCYKATLKEWMELEERDTQASLSELVNALNVPRVNMRHLVEVLLNLKI